MVALASHAKSSGARDEYVAHKNIREMIEVVFLSSLTTDVSRAGRLIFVWYHFSLFCGLMGAHKYLWIFIRILKF